MTAAIASDLPPPMNHVFVDFENVPEVDLTIIGSKAVSLILLLGAKQTKLDAALVEKLMEHAASVHLVRLATSGKNALDFTLAYYLGRTALADPTAYFHIISKDKGFDPLIEHLRSRHIRARRHDGFSTLTFSIPPKVLAAITEDQMERVLQHMSKNLTNRPKKKTTLLSHMKSVLGKDATDEDAAKIVEKLRKAKHLIIDDKESVTYQL